MADKFYVPYIEDSASDWSPNCVVKYEDYEALEVKYQNLLQVISESMRKVEMEIAADD